MIIVVFGLFLSELDFNIMGCGGWIMFVLNFWI